jgi:chorismate mutase
MMLQGGRQVSDEEREYLNEMIRSLNNQLVDALRERDEARREVCRNEANHLPTMADPRREAKRRGWDCFKEDGK